MNNLTLTSSIVLPEQAGIQAQPGYYLVLMRQVREGRIFHRVLQPGEWTTQQNALMRLVLNEGHNLFSIPVKADRNLRHEVTSALKHVSPGHAFNAVYSLDFMVSAPELVATSWQQDPLRMIENEIHRVLDPKPRTTPWETLRIHILRDAGFSLFRDQMRDTVDQLQPFAQTRGFHIHSILMKLELSENDMKPEVAVTGWELDQPVIRIEQERKRTGQTGESQLQAEKAKHEEEVRQIKRQSEIKDALAAAFVKSIEGAGTSDRPEDFLGRLRVLSPLLNGSQGMNLNPAGTTYAQQPAMLGPGGSPESKACAAVYEIASTIEFLDGEPEKKRDILSLFLHLIAEAYRGPKADQNEAQKYSDAIDFMVRDWKPDVDGLKLKTLYRFKELVTVQECLKP